MRTTSDKGATTFGRSTATVELHCSGDPALAKKYGEVILAAGGDYTHCRGYDSRRFISLPLTRVTGNLVNTLVREFWAYDRIGGQKRMTVIVRHGIESVVKHITQEKAEGDVAAYLMYVADYAVQKHEVRAHATYAAEQVRQREREAQKRAALAGLSIDTSSVEGWLLEKLVTSGHVSVETVRRIMQEGAQ